MRKALAIFRRDAMIDMSYPLPFATQWVAIVIGVTGFYYVSKLVAPSSKLGLAGHRSTYFAYVIVNVAFMSLQTSAVQGFSKTLRRDQVMNMIEPVFATPTSVELLAFSSGLWRIAISIAQTLLYLSLGAFLFGLDLHGTNVPALLAFCALSICCMASIGIIGAGIVIYSKQEPPSNFIVGGAASLLAGVLFPVSLLPGPLRALSWCLPMTHALRGVRGAVNGAHFAQLSSDALWLAAATAVLLPTSLFTFSRLVNRARTDGTLAHY